MNGTKLEEFEKACKKEKPQGQNQDDAVRMAYARNMGVEETADIRVRHPNWIRRGLRRYGDWC